MSLGVFGLTACDEVPATDGSVFERDGSRVAPRESMVGNLPGPDPGRETIAEVLRDADAFSRARGLGALLPTLGPDPVQQVKAILTDPVLALHVGATEIELLTRYWATFEPEAATNWAVKQSPLAFRTAAVLSTLPVWAKVDPFAALEASKPWMNRKDVRDFLVAALVLGWYSGGDPPELQSFMQELGVSFSRQRALSAYVRTKLRTGGSRCGHALGRGDPGGPPQIQAGRLPPGSASEWRLLTSMRPSAGVMPIVRVPLEPT